MTLESFLAHRATGVADSQTATGGVGRVIWRHGLTIGFSGDLGVMAAPDVQTRWTLS